MHAKIKPTLVFQCFILLAAALLFITVSFLKSQQSLIIACTLS